MAGWEVISDRLSCTAPQSVSLPCPGPTLTRLATSCGVDGPGRLQGAPLAGKARDHLLKQQVRERPGRGLPSGERPFYQKLETKLFCTLEKKKKKQKCPPQECSPRHPTPSICDTVSPEKATNGPPKAFHLFCFHDLSVDYDHGFCHRRETEAGG